MNIGKLLLRIILSGIVSFLWIKVTNYPFVLSWWILLSIGSLLFSYVVDFLIQRIWRKVSQ